MMEISINRSRKEILNGDETPRLRVNELGIPEEMAFNIMGPIVERKLVKQGYTPLQAMEKVKKHVINI